MLFASWTDLYREVRSKPLTLHPLRRQAASSSSPQPDCGQLANRPPATCVMHACRKEIYCAGDALIT